MGIELQAPGTPRCQTLFHAKSSIPWIEHPSHRSKGRSVPTTSAGRISGSLSRGSLLLEERPIYLLRLRLLHLLDDHRHAFVLSKCPKLIEDVPSGLLLCSRLVATWELLLLSAAPGVFCSARIESSPQLVFANVTRSSLNWAILMFGVIIISPRYGTSCGQTRV